jgi:biotin carboxylase
VAQKFLAAIGFTHGCFNMEFFFDPATDRLSVIEFNPRLASQFSDLYLRVHGVNAHAMSLALAMGQDPAHLPRSAPTAGAAASLVYRVFDPQQRPHLPSSAQQAQLAQQFTDARLFIYAKSGLAVQRDFKWLGSYRYGIIHLGGRDAQHLRQRCDEASALLQWPAPYLDMPAHQATTSAARAGAPAQAASTSPLIGVFR